MPRALCLPTWLLLASSCGAPPPGRAVTGSMRAAVYHDTDHTTIGTVTGAVRARPSAEVTLGARYLLDVTTSASIDVVASATKRWSEPRNEYGGSVGFADGTTTIGASYTHSNENDWWSHSGAFDMSRDLSDHDVTVGIGASFTHNDVGRSGDANFKRQLEDIKGRLQLVWVADPMNIFSLGYEIGQLSGYQASPYRYARLRDSAGAILLGIPERMPDARTRHSGTLRWNHAFSESVALRSHVRGYGDEWGVLSVTIGTELQAQIDDVVIGFMVRGYAQTGATFYQDIYAQPRDFMTSDRELSPFADGFAGPVFEWSVEDAGPLAELHVDLKVSGFAFKFFEFSRLPERYGVVGELGVGGSF